MIKDIPYLHVLDGRIRVKISELKGSHQKAQEIKCNLMKMDGITYVKANTITGNVLILFESDTISPEQILKELIKDSYLPDINEVPHVSKKNKKDSSSSLGSKVAEAFFLKATELAAELLILSLV